MNTTANTNLRLPAEYEPQSFVQLIFPHADSDWAPYLEEASATFVQIANAVARFQPCLIVCDDVARVKGYFEQTHNLYFIPYKANDTWARDCSGITVESATGCSIRDFTFTGWGDKFDAAKDNAMTKAVAACYGVSVEAYDFILEGGAIESNGEGLLFVTEQCVINPNRNAELTRREEVESVLRDTLGTRRVLWLTSGYLAGDDTDSHIDTLARFCGENTICYVQCTNPEPFELVALPMANAAYFDGERLPATYANFLIINGAVLVPTYNDPHDAEALAVMQSLFPDREIIGIDCSVLIRQHGSLHCVTMQFPACVTLQC